MGAIRETATGETRTLEASNVIGRIPAPQSTLSLSESYVSGVHAELRWTGQVWELKDLGSRNGTYLNGRRIDPAVPQAIDKGCKIAFGKPVQEWEMVDDSAPSVMVVPLAGGEPVVLEGDLIALPSSADPRATIYRAADGTWVLESPDEPPKPVVHQQTFEAAGRLWRFSSPDMPQSTLAAAVDWEGARLEVKNLHLVIAVSLDEEFVHLRMTCGGKEFDMGSRKHNYLLLILARLRLAEAAEGLPETSCGWLDPKAHGHDPTMAPPQLNIDVFRIREQFGKVGVIDAAGIIERRPEHLRLGTGRVSIVTV